MQNTSNVTLFVFMCLYFCILCFFSDCICHAIVARWVNLVGLKPNSEALSSCSALTLLVWPFPVCLVGH